MKKLTIYTILILSILSLHAQDSVMVRKWIEALSSSGMYGRSFAYQGDSIAAAYLKQQLITNSIAPLQGDYYQSYTLPNFAMEGNVKIEFNGKTLDPYNEYRIWASSKSIQKDNIPVITVEPEIILSTKNLTKFKDKHYEKISQSIIYVDILNPKFQKKDKDGEKRKAILQTLHSANPFQSLGYIIPVNKLPAWSVSNHEKERDYALLYICETVFPKKWKNINIHFNNRHDIHQTQNVCAKVEGTQYPDSMILFVAHYDHVGVMGEVLFPGAHDNASGTATVMALAHYFKKNPLPYTTVFCFFSGEEIGLKGSTYFVEHPVIDLKKVKMVLNIDMACGGNAGLMMVNSQADDTRHLYDRFVNVNKEKGYFPEIKSRPNAANSDHYPFTKNGVPAVFIYVLGGKSGGYHQPTDTSANCSLEKWEELFHLIVDVINFYK